MGIPFILCGVSLTGKGKRAASYNLPNPNGFLFPSKTTYGKRSEEDEDQDDDPMRLIRHLFNSPRPSSSIWPAMRPTKRGSGGLWNMAKPNGFIFPTLHHNAMPSQKRTSYEEMGEDYEEIILNWLQNYLASQKKDEFLDRYHPTAFKRDNFDAATFFAGRGKRAEEGEGDELDAFFAGRGKKADSEMDLDSFFAGRGKKAPKVSDIFFAGRGKRSGAMTKEETD